MKYAVELAATALVLTALVGLTYLGLTYWGSGGGWIIFVVVLMGLGINIQIGRKE